METRRDERPNLATRSSNRKYPSSLFTLLAFLLAATASTIAFAAASGAFDQNDWSGGQSAVTAAHPGDQTGWQVYSAKDADLNAGTDLQLNPVSDSATHAQASDFSIDSNISRTQQTHIDFAIGSTKTGALVGGTGVTLGYATRVPAWTAKSAWNRSRSLNTLTWVATGDLDGDGDIDMMVGDTYYYFLHTYINAGTITTPQWSGGPSAGGSGEAKPALADLDSDGDLDLLVGSVYTGSITAYENTGDSSTPIWTVHNGWNLAGPTRPALADLDGDGDYDLMADNHAYENTGDSSSPTWTANSSWDAPLTGSPALADLDGDGDFDLLIGGSDGIAHAYENTGDSSSPSWTANSAWDTPDVGTYAAPAFADLDDDGDPDLLIADGSTGNIYGYENTGTGTYKTSGTFESSVIDTGGNQGYDTLDYTVVERVNTTITIDARAGDTAVPDGGWTAWQTDIADGGDISSLGAHRYFQYRVNLATTDDTVTPELQSITVNYFNYPYGPNGSVQAGGGVGLKIDYSPATEGTWTAPGGTLSALDISGNYAYVVRDTGNSTSRLYIIDVSDPTAPVEVAETSHNDRVLDVDVVGNYAYVAVAGHGVAIEDVSDPTTPVLKSTYDTSGWSCNVVVSGTYAYVADNAGGLLILDVSNPSSASSVANYTAAGPVCGRMMIAGNYLYIADISAGLEIYDISDPSSPLLVSTYAGTAKDVYVTGHLAYLVGAGLKVLDITNPASPTLINTVSDVTSGFTIDISGDAAYVTEGFPNVLKIFDLVDPTSPTLITTYDMHWGDAKVIGNRAYATYNATGAYNLQVITLGQYQASATFMSSVIDLNKNLGFTTLDYTADIPASTTLTVDVRAGDTPVPDGSWSAWQTNVATGGDISGLPVARYVQYRVNLATADTTVTPVLDNITVNFTRYALTASLTSSAYDSGDAANLIEGIGWSENLPAGTDVRFQIRTAPDNGGTPGTWSDWTGPDGSSASYWNSANTFGGACSGSGTISCTTPTVVRDGIGDQWFQYRVVTTTTDPSATPTVTDVSLNYDSSTSAAGAITITPTSAQVTAENGGQATFSVVLDSAPSADVTIDLYSTDTSEGAISPTSLTFTNGDWSTPQTVTVTGQDDFVDDGDIGYSVITGASMSADPAFNVLNPIDVTFTNTDDDTAGITVSPTSGLTTTESGGATAFTVVLDSQPLQDVSVAVSSSNPAEGTASPGSLTFTNSNWSTPQVVTVTGVDDVTVDGDIDYTIMTAPATSADGLYNGFDASDVQVTNTDNDTVALVVTPSTLTTSESGGTATFTVKLAARPASSVSFTLSSSDTSEGVLSLLSTSYTFNPDEWDTPKSGTLFGVNDAVADGNVDYSVVTSAFSSADPVWNGVDPADIPATNLDNNSYSIQVTPTSGLHTTEDGGTAQFTIILGASPSSDVTIPLSSSDPGEGVVTPSSVTFTPDDTNWRHGGITVTVTGVDDHDVDGDIPYTIVTGPAVSADMNYDGMDGPDVSVTNQDNEFSRSTLENNIASSSFGKATTTGDINGDGLQDLIVDAPSDSSVGKVRIYYGTPTGYSSTPDWTVEGTQTNGAFGSPLATADVNGDGYDDLIVGAPYYYNGQTFEGRVFVFYGSSTGLPDANADGVVEISDASWIAESDQANANFGGHVSSAGDINGDGYDDIIVSTTAYDNDQVNEGRVFVYYGSATGLPYTNCAALGDGVAHPCDAGWIAESDQSNSNFGISIAGAGDVNGDGYDDVIIGASNYSSNITFGFDEGRAFVFYGSASGLSYTDCSGKGDGIAHLCEASWTGETSTLNAGFGGNVASIGDVNGDGYDDIIIAAGGYPNGSLINSGRVFAYYGSASGLPDANADGIAVDSDASWTANNDQDFTAFAASIASGDFNGDGYNDVIIGSYFYDVSQINDGRFFIYNGSATGLPNTNCASTGGNIAHLCEAWWISETDQASSFLGNSVGSVGDLNGDGRDDFYAAADGYDDGQIDEGAVFFFLSHPADAPGFTITPSSGLITTESGATATFNMTLTASPTADVTIALSSNNTGEGTVSPTSLTFTTVNWNTPQTVTITGVNDAITDGDIGYNIITDSAVSADPDYDGLDPPDVNVTNIDNDIPVTVSVTASDGSESGGSGSFTFTRTGENTMDLTAYYTVGGTATAGLDYNALSGSVTIPAGVISTTVPLNVLDDGIVEGDETVDVTLSLDANYTVGTPGSATATISDNDAAGVDVFAGVDLITTEAGGSATFTVKLASQPSADVTMALSSSDTSEGLVTPTSLTFTPANWGAQQTVTVVGQDDAVADGDVNYSIVIGNTVSGDPNYDGIVVPVVSMVNIDNEGTANVSVTASVASIGEGSSTPGVFTISRTGATTNDLRVFYSVTGTAQSSVDYAPIGGSVVIPAGSSSATVNVVPIQDAVVESDETVILTLASSSDYVKANPGSNTVTILDDDVLGGGSAAPAANFYVDQTVGEGTIATVNVVLSGTALSYPVVIPYTVSGTATGGVDHDAVDGNVAINSGTAGAISVNVFSDADTESDETIVFTMGTPINARLGGRTTHTITITDGNAPPEVTLTAAQGGLATHLVTTGGGNVTVTAAVTDPNTGDLHSYDWSSTNATVLTNEVGGPSTTATFVFNPAGLTNGDFYAVRLTVTDNGAPAKSTSVDLMLKVDVAPTLTSVDSDSDGVADDLESYDDSDDDGIANYLDSSTQGGNELPMFAAQGDTYLIRTEPGLSLKLGETALAAGSDGALVSTSDIANYGGGEGQPGANATDTVPNTGGYSDFEITGLQQAGQSVRVVLPQLAPLPVGAVFRKYDPVTGWRNYSVDVANGIASALGSPGVCPPPGDNTYTPGLTVGNNCIQLTIQDGGPNDADGVVNYTVKDPSGIAKASVTASTSSTPPASSGGGTMDWPALMGLAVLALLGRRCRPPSQR
jgi:hypothetical protein